MIVPGLGGFVTQYVPARYVEEEQLFLPPYRSVGFNPRLTLNDGLLVQSYMLAYDTSYPETQRIIENAVAEMKQVLQERGSYELSGIGTLMLDVSGRYEFAPCEAGVLSPELYGLSSFNVAPVVPSASAPKAGLKRRRRRPRLVKRSERSYVFRINKEVVNYVAAAVVAVIFYFAWAAPAVVDEDPTTGRAAMLAPMRMPAAASGVGEAVPSVVAEAKAHPSALKPEVLADSIDTVDKSSMPEEGEYTIVLASSVAAKNAQNYVTGLQKKGYGEAEVYKRGRMVRVVYRRFATESAAYACLDTLRSRREFSDAWVMKLKQ